MSVPDDEMPSSWRDPEYVATVAGVVSTGALFFYSALVASAPSPEAVGFVLLWVLLPASIGYEVARRWL